MLFYIILLFSFIQSLFGVGLLVFGTPTLILLGYSFTETLSILLPSSVVISIIQLFNTGIGFKSDNILFLKWCVPSVVISLLLFLIYNYTLDVTVPLAIILIFLSLLRLNINLKNHAKKVIFSYPRTYMVAMGVAHGVSNLGGGFLSLYAGIKYENKIHIRTFISYGYLLFATIQLTILFLMDHLVFGYNLYLFPLIAASVYFLIGRVVYKFASNKFYNTIFSVFMFVYGIMLIIWHIYYK